MFAVQRSFTNRLRLGKGDWVGEGTNHMKRLERIAEKDERRGGLFFGLSGGIDGTPDDRVEFYIIDRNWKHISVQVDEEWELEEVGRRNTGKVDCYGFPIWQVFVRPLKRIEEPVSAYFDTEADCFVVQYRSGARKEITHRELLQGEPGFEIVRNGVLTFRQLQQQVPRHYSRTGVIVARGDEQLVPFKDHTEQFFMERFGEVAREAWERWLVISQKEAERQRQTQIEAEERSRIIATLLAEADPDRYFYFYEVEQYSITNVLLRIDPRLVPGERYNDECVVAGYWRLGESSDCSNSWYPEEYPDSDAIMWLPVETSGNRGVVEVTRAQYEEALASARAHAQQENDEQIRWTEFLENGVPELLKNADPEVLYLCRWHSRPGYKRFSLMTVDPRRIPDEYLDTSLPSTLELTSWSYEYQRYAVSGSWESKKQELIRLSEESEFESLSETLSVAVLCSSQLR